MPDISFYLHYIVTQPDFSKQAYVMKKDVVELR